MLAKREPVAEKRTVIVVSVNIRTALIYVWLGHRRRYSPIPGEKRESLDPPVDERIRRSGPGSTLVHSRWTVSLNGVIRRAQEGMDFARHPFGVLQVDVVSPLHPRDP